MGSNAVRETADARRYAMKRMGAIALWWAIGFLSTEGVTTLGATHMRSIRHRVDSLSRSAGTGSFSVWLVVFRTVIDVAGSLESGAQKPAGRQARSSYTERHASSSKT